MGKKRVKRNQKKNQSKKLTKRSNNNKEYIENKKKTYGLEQ